MKKLVLSLFILGSGSAFAMEEASSYTQPVRNVYFALGEFISSQTPQQNKDALTKLKNSIAKLTPAETKLRDNFTGNSTITELIKNSRNNVNLPADKRQGLTEALILLEAKPLEK